MAMTTLAGAAQAWPLRCTLVLAAPVARSGPVKIRMQWVNEGTQPLRVLTWGTPFEGGWFGPWLTVWHDGQVLPYQGAMVKRSAPQPVDYLLLKPGQRRQATVDLAGAFDLTRPGRYEVRPAVRLHDVRTASGRPEAMQAVELACGRLVLVRPGG